MDLGNSPRFSIVEEPSYAHQLLRLVADPRLRDDIQQSFDLDIARNPYECEEIPFTKIRAITIACIPLLTIYFRIDDEDGERVIYLIDVHRMP